MIEHLSYISVVNKEDQIVDIHTLLYAANGKDFICDAARSNRKDVRDTVEIASKTVDKQLSNFNRSQILYYFAENLEQRERNFVDLLVSLRGVSNNLAKKYIFIIL